jgi:hypothetical protein
MSKSGKRGAKKPKSLPPQKWRKTGGRKLRNGLDPSIGKATQIQPGEVRNPGGRPKGLISDATRDWLKAVDPKTRKTNAQLVVEAQGKKGKKGETAAYNALADRSEGRPAQTQQHEIISNSPVNVKIEAPDLISTLRQIYGLSQDSGSQDSRGGDSQQSAKTVSVSEKMD